MAIENNPLVAYNECIPRDKPNDLLGSFIDLVAEMVELDITPTLTLIPNIQTHFLCSRLQ
jgi:hypothetical protein